MLFEFKFYDLLQETNLLFILALLHFFVILVSGRTYCLSIGITFLHYSIINGMLLCVILGFTDDFAMVSSVETDRYHQYFAIESWFTKLQLQTLQMGHAFGSSPGVITCFRQLSVKHISAKFWQQKYLPRMEIYQLVYNRQVSVYFVIVPQK